MDEYQFELLKRSKKKLAHLTDEELQQQYDLSKITECLTLLSVLAMALFLTGTTIVRVITVLAWIALFLLCNWLSRKVKRRKIVKNVEAADCTTCVHYPVCRYHENLLMDMNDELYPNAEKHCKFFESSIKTDA